MRFYFPFGNEGYAQSVSYAFRKSRVSGSLAKQTAATQGTQTMKEKERISSSSSRWREKKRRKNNITVVIIIIIITT